MIAPPSSTDVVAIARELGRETARQLELQVGAALSFKARTEAVRAFQRALVPARKRGRRRIHRITTAHEDRKRGVRGLALYTAHIPGYLTFNSWRRSCEARRLMEAIRSRERREKSKQNEAISGGQSD
jgi:hypothetical protein